MDDKEIKLIQQSKAFLASPEADATNQTSSVTPYFRLHACVSLFKSKGA